MENDPLDRAAAWDLYLALDLLAASQALGSVPSMQGVPDDLAYARAQTEKHRAALERGDPELLGRIEAVFDGWTSRPTSRLVELLPLRDELSDRSGGALPDTLPPAP